MIISENRRAYFDYDILEKYEAGIELFGFEVKAVKSGRINLAGAYAVFRAGEIYLINADIPPYQPKNTPENYDSRRSRKLLLKKAEIKNLLGRINQGLTVVPLKVYTKNRLVKVELALGRGRKRKDKREILKKKAAEREIRKYIRE